jgi:hypothetical protein
MNLKRASIPVLLVLIVALTSFSCTPKNKGSSSSSDTTTTVSQKPCEAFCQHLRTLGCREGQPLPDGTPCEKFCIDTQEAGLNLNIPCILQTQSCGDLQRCNR